MLPIHHRHSIIAQLQHFLIGHPTPLLLLLLLLRGLLLLQFGGIDRILTRPEGQRNRRLELDHPPGRPIVLLIRRRRRIHRILPSHRLPPVIAFGDPPQGGVAVVTSPLLLLRLRVLHQMRPSHFEPAGRARIHFVPRRIRRAGFVGPSGFLGGFGFAVVLGRGVGVDFGVVFGDGDGRHHDEVFDEAAGQFVLVFGEVF
mmetsp:Transcript_22295/g.43092  ORF Transcript_22295/g.43092 Transcript_22295/m.43092 type:complete len:200 (+) Transcript_22295:482-1081(+)